jgi:hypothetical protein
LNEQPAAAAWLVRYRRARDPTLMTICVRAPSAQAALDEVRRRVPAARIFGKPQTLS